jgi:hypothetical protein
VLAAGAARGNGWPAREKLGRIELSRSLEWCRIDKQTIQSQNHGKISPKSEGIVLVIVWTLKNGLES